MRIDEDEGKFYCVNKYDHIYFETDTKEKAEIFKKGFEEGRTEAWDEGYKEGHYDAISL